MTAVSPPPQLIPLSFTQSHPSAAIASMSRPTRSNAGFAWIDRDRKNGLFRAGFVPEKVR